MKTPLKPPANPCVSCPYRKDVPSGLWHPSEYAKLPDYDLETHMQPLAVFMCHQQTGHLCGGWLMAHDRQNLLALRVHRVDPSVWRYSTSVPCFKSGKAAQKHGLKKVNAPDAKGLAMIRKLVRNAERRARP